MKPARVAGLFPGYYAAAGFFEEKPQCSVTTLSRARKTERKPKMPESRAKGKRGELEAADALGRIGLCCRRSAQYCGKNGDADLICEGLKLHIEVKLCERLNPYRFIEQAVDDSRKTRRTPIVVMRSSYKPWLVCLRLDDVLAFVEEIHRVNAQVRSALEGQDDAAQGVSRQPLEDPA